MATESSERDILDVLGEEYVTRYRRGERPSVSEYTQRYPAYAKDIEEFFQAMVCVEEFAGCPAATEANKVAVPRQIGEYEIIREVGRGGMGVVYEAEQGSLGRRVALKILPASALLDPTQLERFRREAKAAARLHHTNIVPVFGTGEHDGVHYYAMQYIQGHGIDAVLNEIKRLRAGPKFADVHPDPVGVLAHGVITGRFRMDDAASAETSSEIPTDRENALSASAAAPTPLASSSTESQVYCRSVGRIGVQAAEALAYAHAHGVVHRDIKPSNLLLDAQGTVWITDFGLAKAEDSDNLTHTGDVVGTLRYMAPERFAGRSDPRGDVYGLGATLYEMLTLQAPFTESDRGRLIRLVTQDEPPRPRRLDASIPRDLETIVLKAIAKEPEQRYQSAHDLADDLKRYVADKPIQARRASVWEHTWRWCRRNPALATATSIAATALVALAIGGPLAAMWWKDQRDAAQFHAGEANANAAEAQRQERLAQQNLYAAHIHMIEQALDRDDMRQALALLEGLRPRPGQDDLRGFEWYYLWRLCHQGHRLTLRGHSSPVIAVAYSPSPDLLASGDEAGTIVLWDVPAGRVRSVLRGHAGPVRSLAFSPDGQTLASGSDDQTVRLWRPDTGEEKFILRGHSGPVLTVAFSPDGGALACGGEYDRTIHMWDPVTGQERPGLQDNMPTRAVVFSPDGRTLASGDTVGLVKLWNVATRRHRPAQRVHRFGVQSMAFSPDGKILASGSEDRSIILWNATTLLKQEVIEDNISSVASVAFSPDGKFLFCGTSAGPVKVRDLANGQSRVFGLNGRTQVAVSPDGTHWASASQDRTVKLWDMPKDLTPPPAPAPRQLVFTVAFSPDGRTVASAGDDPVVKLWDVATGQVRQTLPGHNATVRSVAFAPDGRSLVSGDELGVLMLWDPATKQVRWTAKHRRRVTCVAFSPDSSTAASASLDGTIRFWQTATGQERLSMQADGQGFANVVFSSDGRRLLSGDRGNRLTFWDTSTGEELAAYDSPVGFAAYSPDGKTVAVRQLGGTFELSLWDAATARTRATVPSREVRTRLATFAPDSCTLAVANWEGTLAFVDVATARVRATLSDPRHWVYSLAYSPDGHTLATGGWDGSVKFWRTATDEDVRSQSSFGE